jgi:uncharacterized membrane protein HdeD (DUF308 family)
MTPTHANAPPAPRDTGAPAGDALDAPSALLSRNWGLVLLRGLAGIVFGAVALFLPGPTIATLVLLFAAYMLVDGAFAVLSGVRAARRNERWGWFVVEGILDIGAGIIAFLWPGLTLIVLVWLLAFWALLSGAVMLAAAFRLGKAHGRWLLGLGGVISIVWGVLLVFAPIAGAFVMTLWLGAYALVFGIALVVLALRLRREHRRAPIGQPSAA